MREADAAIVVGVTFGFVGVTEVEMIIDVEEIAAGAAPFGAVVEVEAATGAVAKLEVEAETAVLLVWVRILVEGTNFEAETAMFEEELEVARSLA